MTALERSLGQFRLYRFVLARRDPDRTLYLALPAYADASVFRQPDGTDLIDAEEMRLLVFDPTDEVVTQWIG